MAHTTLYRFQNLKGYEKVISEGNSDMNFMGFARILLGAGESLTYTAEGEEQGIVLQSGDMTVTVEYKGKEVIKDAKGTRGNVFDDLPTAVYLPPNATITISSEKGMEARVFTAYCDEGNDPCFVPPENIEEGEPGEYIYKRRYRFIFGQPGKHNDHISKLLIVGETVSIPGGWIGWPAHRHDYVTEKECVLDEIFSFQVRSEGPTDGGCYVHGFDMDENNKKLWDEVHVVESSNVAIGLPSGYHTTIAMPGTEAYLFWGLAGGKKQYQVQFDERNSWLEGCLY